MAQRSMNTMSEGLAKLRQFISDLKAAPDADVPWLIDLESTILAKEREPIDKMMSDMGGPMQEMAPLNSFPGGAPTGPQAQDPIAAMLAGGGGGMPGGGPPTSRAPQPMPMTNPDELRRALRRGAVQGG